MHVRQLVKRLIEATGYSIYKMGPTVYNADCLISWHNHDFMHDPSFMRAYDRGVRATNFYYPWHWRVHIGLWVAFSASKLDGDFVECGVNKGFLSSAIMEYLDWNSLNKKFYLLDTFSGLDERFLSEEEIRAGALDRNKKSLESGHYVSGIESVQLNFSEWKDVRIIQGAIPETLSKVDSTRIAYLHLDMNCSPPEVAAANFFWDRLVPGAFILMDDYGFPGFQYSKIGMDNFASEKGLKIASLPTGQGLLVKPV